MFIFVNCRIKLESQIVISTVRCKGFRSMLLIFCLLIGQFMCELIFVNTFAATEYDKLVNDCICCVNFVLKHLNRGLVYLKAYYLFKTILI